MCVCVRAHVYLAFISKLSTSESKRIWCYVFMLSSKSFNSELHIIVNLIAADKIIYIYILYIHKI